MQRPAIASEPTCGSKKIYRAALVHETAAVDEERMSCVKAKMHELELVPTTENARMSRNQRLGCQFSKPCRFYYPLVLLGFYV